MELVKYVLEGEVVTDSNLDVRQIAILASLLVPLAVSFVTKQTASDGLRAVVNIIGSALVSALAIWINPSDQAVTFWLFVNTFLAALVASFVAYKAVWKPTGVAGSITEKTANIGLGSPPTMETDSKGAEEANEMDYKDYPGKTMPDGPDIGETEHVSGGEPIGENLDHGDLDRLVETTPLDHDKE